MMMASAEIAKIGVLLVVILLLPPSNGYPTYQQYIPNGGRIPNPCNRLTTWPGVGHENIYGSGPRNPFGRDFQGYGHTWTWALCMRDSDEDGRTNGEELGDPNCTWTIVDTPSITNSSSLSHPGVCEPIDSLYCRAKNYWLEGCGPRPYDCPAINDSAVSPFVLRLWWLRPVPNVESTYMCSVYSFTSYSTTDIIAFEPIVVNAEIVNHMSLFGCTGELDRSFGDTFNCGIEANLPCRDLIGFWTVGVDGVCLNSQMGYRIGPNDFKYVILQVHWNNPLLKQNLTDYSGMKIYRTSNLRPNRGGILTVGQNYLDIPPNQQEVTYTGNCSSGCTKELNQSIFITSTFLHMHSAGMSGVIALYRNGVPVYTFEAVTGYDYNNPKLNALANAIEVKPGDKISVKCVYSSLGRNYTTVGGEATSDEMCYALLSYYPLIDELQFCGQWKTVDVCKASSGAATFNSEYCDVPSFLEILPLTMNACNASCTETTACRAIVNEIYDTECPNNPDVMQYTRDVLPSYLDLYERCASVVAPRTETPTTKTPTTETPTTETPITEAPTSESPTSSSTSAMTTTTNHESHDNYPNRSTGLSVTSATVAMFWLFCISLAKLT